jgi:hypothetical protein
VHNILIAEPTPGSGPMAGRTDHKWRRVTNYTGDDGLWITEVGFTSDAKTIVTSAATARIGKANRRTRRSCRTAPIKRCLRFRSQSGAPKRLGLGSGPVASPRGQRVAWVSRGQIWSADLATTEAPARLVNRARQRSGCRGRR